MGNCWLYRNTKRSIGTMWTVAPDNARVRNKRPQTCETWRELIPPPTLLDGAKPAVEITHVSPHPFKNCVRRCLKLPIIRLGFRARPQKYPYVRHNNRKHLRPVHHIARAGTLSFRTERKHGLPLKFLIVFTLTPFPVMLYRKTLALGEKRLTLASREMLFDSVCGSRETFLSR